MLTIGKIVTGGFLAGYRTYIMGFVLAAQAVASYLVGDMSLLGLTEELPEIVGGLGLMSLRAAIPKQ